MVEDPDAYFAFLANAYIAEPTPENAQRLWRSVFALDGLYFLLRPLRGEQVPAIALQDGVPFLLVWTDLGTLRSYIAEKAESSENEGNEDRYMLVPMEQVMEHIFRYAQYGVKGVRFNPPLGWSVPFERLRLVAEHFGVV